jgi:hypothetical protein
MVDPPTAKLRSRGDGTLGGEPDIDPTTPTGEFGVTIMLSRARMARWRVPPVLLL